MTHSLDCFALLAMTFQPDRSFDRRGVPLHRCNDPGYPGLRSKTGPSPSGPFRRLTESTPRAERIPAVELARAGRQCSRQLRPSLRHCGEGVAGDWVRGLFGAVDTFVSAPLAFETLEIVDGHCLASRPRRPEDITTSTFTL